MIVAAQYSFKGGGELLRSRYPGELSQVETVIAEVPADAHRLKVSQERTMSGRLLYRPGSLNKAFAVQLALLEWSRQRVLCHYSGAYYTPGFLSNARAAGAFREIDFIKNRVGLEVQFGKYAFAVYNVCAKMTIFSRLGFIDVGIEIVPVKMLADEMSSGVTYFEQLVWDLEHRGEADIDIPVLILGVAP
jgi:hypothetical protein